ncbi:hypothetical protein AHAT_19140 [Agarivorans sp. Toyoura001]|uniref:hypothetical protein n=1 Tax=Agarivorans sp. Toyoura001 TaxID=2283141 RepID=UPI0010E897DF|nr:hypothetical protein [Agarivorans sp. Toyoura001]GDY26024.1 hypothetical protein AHAT_19140 [Agarivorans sp. Toyoura001]
MDLQVEKPIPANDPNWQGLTPYEAAKRLTQTQREKGTRCCFALRQILAGEREAPDYHKTVLGA